MKKLAYLITAALLLCGMLAGLSACTSKEQPPNRAAPQAQEKGKVLEVVWDGAIGWEETRLYSRHTGDTVAVVCLKKTK